MPAGAAGFEVGMMGTWMMAIGLAYAAGAIGYALHFHRPSRFRRRLGLVCLLGGWAGHTAFLLWVWAVSGQLPLTPPMLPTLCAWLVVIVYFYLECYARDHSLGFLILPIVLALHLLSAIHLPQMDGGVLRSVRGLWFQMHVVAFLLAYAAFAVSAVSAALYIMLLGEIQAKHLGYFYKRLPSLGILSQFNNRAANFGFLFLTVAGIASTVYAHQELYRVWVWGEPAFLPILITWVVYAVHLLVRWLIGWEGRRAALLSILGFSLVLLAFPVVGIFFSARHPLGP